MSRATIESYFDGVLTARWDASATPRTYYEYDAAGVVTFQRAYTPEEDAYATAIIAEETKEASRVTDRQLVKAIIADLKLEKDRIQPTIDATKATINADPGAYIKDVARAAKRIADASIDLARFVQDID